MLLALFAAPALAGGHPAPEIPEPMVFDLVRGLGAAGGEIEANTLGQLDLDNRVVAWAPEVELALHDNVAVELELPMSGTELVALKGAFQVTFNVPTPWFVHGLQMITEHHLAGGHEFSGLYLWGLAPEGRLSVLGMSGARSFDGPDEPRHVKLLQNTSLFVHLAHGAALGFETNVAWRAGESMSTLLMPQLHLDLVPGFAVQAGAGARGIGGEFFPAAGGRVIASGRVRGGRTASSMSTLGQDTEM